MSYRLMSLLVDKWDTLDGFAVAHRMDSLIEIDYSRLSNFVYWHFTKEAENDSIEKFRARLWQPPRGQVADPRSPWSPENEAAAFSNAKAMFGA